MIDTYLEACVTLNQSEMTTLTIGNSFAGKKVNYKLKKCATNKSGQWTSQAKLCARLCINFDI